MQQVCFYTPNPYPNKAALAWSAAGTLPLQELSKTKRLGCPVRESCMSVCCYVDVDTLLLLGFIPFAAASWIYPACCCLLAHLTCCCCCFLASFTQLTNTYGSDVIFTAPGYVVTGSNRPLLFGPTLRLKRGDTFSITLANELVQNEEEIEGHWGFAGPMDTNLHTHGLHDVPGELCCRALGLKTSINPATSSRMTASLTSLSARSSVTFVSQA